MSPQALFVKTSEVFWSQENIISWAGRRKPKGGWGRGRWWEGRDPAVRRKNIWGFGVSEGSSGLGTGASGVSNKAQQKVGNYIWKSRSDWLSLGP